MVDLEDLADDITQAQKTAHDRCSQFVRGLIKLGGLIKEAEKRVDRKDWDTWLADTVGMTPRLAARYAELAEDPTPPNNIAARIVMGALRLNLSDEIKIPDADHIVKATDLHNRTLYIWPADKDGLNVHVIVFGADRKGYECSNKPLLARTAHEVLALDPIGGFSFGNADYQIIPASKRDLDMFDDMLRRHQEKAFRRRLMIGEDDE